MVTPPNNQSKSSLMSDLENHFTLLGIDDEFEKDEHPTLSLAKLKSVPTVSTKYQFMVISEDSIAFTTVNNILSYLNRKAAKKIEEIDINKCLGYSCKIKHLFMDPVFGYHILISLTSSSNANSMSASVAPPCDLFYLNTSTPNYKLKQMNKIRGHDVTAVGWNRLNFTSQSSGPILFGTSKGLIFEVEIMSEPDKFFQSNVETYCRQVFDIGKTNTTTVITGIEFYRFSNASDRYFIIVTTISRLYQFVGKTNLDEKPFLVSVFNNYLHIPEGFLEMPNDNDWSQLQICFLKKTNDSGKIVTYPKSVAWHIKEVGVTFAEIKSEWEEGTSNVLIHNRHLDHTPSESIAISFILTEFHVLLLNVDKITALSVLNKEIVFTQAGNEGYGKNISLSRDTDGNIFLLSDKAIHEGKFIHEDKSIWKVYLDMGDFSLAKKNCEPNSKKFSLIMEKEAEHLFNRKMFMESASTYAQIEGLSFEVTALKFLEIGQIEALKLYLLKTLEKLTSLESAHITLITLWLLEIFEKQLADERHNSEVLRGQSQLQESFETFLSLPNVQTCIRNNKETAYNIMSSHGDSHNLIKLAASFNDYEIIVRHYLEEDQVLSAINLLKEDSVVFKHKNLIYTFLPEFMSLAPKDTVLILKKLGHKIEPLSVLPYLIFPSDVLTDNEAIEVINYLEYCIHSLHCLEEPIHTYLITLYAKYKPDKILQYLATQGQDPSMVNYEIRYALKLCREIGLTEACVQLSAMLGLWENAVDLALSISKDLAKQTVQMASQSPTNNVELCKKLWLKIAKHVVNEHNDIKEAMKFLQQCDLIKIEDVLPFFNDFVTIDHFKDAICSSLQEYNQNIEMLREEMDDASKSASMIRSDIQAFKHRYTVIQASDLCCSCNIQLLLRPFYIFPCSHYFHTDCLIRELKPYLNESDVTRINHLQSQLYVNSPAISHSDGVSNTPSTKEQIKQELDQLIASECFFCGSITIDHIDRPFIEDDEFERIRLEWE
ncbi:hypothetical protein V9T40_011482 [Parthenolecanium corni]|uniref:Vacuolar protein sorting-associated protein 18 homolog n=1 Tax=Parthenolecanium corni TaxID=536013 RepID=A0AAN9TKF6_9HEMI